MNLFRSSDTNRNVAVEISRTGDDYSTMDAGSYFSSSSSEPHDESIIISSIDDFIPKTQIDPWHRLSALEHDCVFIVEFSELEGPKPSICIPDSPGAHFDRNDFAVWLMTADYQASNHRGTFSINDDIQLLLNNEEQGVRTYAHHFTLFDVEARGYVRPFCVTYVTPDTSKLDRLFDSLRREFNKLLAAVKLCNRRLFYKELTEAVEELRGREHQAISSYYELCYEERRLSAFSDSDVDQERATIDKPKRLAPDNARYARLQRQLELVRNAVAADTTRRNSVVCKAHSIDIHQWTDSLSQTQGVEKKRKTLKELSALCPCVYDEFQRQLRTIWMKFRHWNVSSEWMLKGGERGWRINIGSMPILYFPADEEPKDDEPARRRHSTSENGDDWLFSLTEVDALQNLRSGWSPSKQDDHRRLLASLSSRLRYFLYPILTGQLLVIFGGELRQQLIIDLIRRLKLFVPTAFSSPKCSLWHDDGRLPESAVCDYKLFGLHVPQKAKLDDYISENQRKYVALLDLNNDVLRAAEYRGDLLGRIVSRANLYRSDWTLTLAMLAVLSEYASLAYVFSCCLWRSTAENGLLPHPNKKLREVSTSLRLGHGDLKIVRYLVELLNTQQHDEAVDSQMDSFDDLLLEHEAPKLFKL